MTHSGADFPEAWLAGARCFDAGEWWQAHEAWEEEWLQAEGQRRAALQALILLAAALHKRWRQGRPTRNNFVKAQAYLRELPAGAYGLDWMALERAVDVALDGDVVPTALSLPLLGQGQLN